MKCAVLPISPYEDRFFILLIDENQNHTIVPFLGFDPKEGQDGYRRVSMSIPGILVLRSRNLSSASSANTITKYTTATAR